MPFGKSNKNQKMRNAKSDSALQQPQYDPKTNQKIVHGCVVCAFDRTLVDNTQPIQQDKLSDLLVSHLNKRRSHKARLLCLQDHMAFQKKSFLSKSLFHDKVMYKDIEHYFLCSEYPNIFMLSLKSEIPGSSYYETYKCKNVEDAKRLCNMVYEACQQPDKTIHDIPPVSHAQSLDVSSLKSKSLSHIDTQTSSDVVNKASLNRSLSQSLNDGWATPKLHDDSPIQSPLQSSMHSPLRSPLLSYQSPVPTPINQDSTIKPLMVTPVNTDNTAAYVSGEVDAVDMKKNTTYFDYDPVHGPQINEVGPIYMFMVRHPSQHDMLNLMNEP
uniref:Trematode PH-like domain-containing protein n=1 Tax=Trichobilharzia regenti TaxID=157069 RepID=A0AA85JCR5_TRIRE|nr:unnamed protein product [Trichobilharzia regenti]